MSQFDGTGEKRRDGGDSGAFRGRRHPFLDRRVDWKAIDRARHGSEVGADVGDRIGMMREVPSFQLTNGSEPCDKRVAACVAAVQQLSTNFEKWNVIRSSMVDEYKSAGPMPPDSERALLSFINAVNQRLGETGEINAENVTKEEAENIAAAENVTYPELSMNIRVWHSGGLMGPIGVCFTNRS